MRYNETRFCIYYNNYNSFRSFLFEVLKTFLIVNNQSLPATARRTVDNIILSQILNLGGIVDKKSAGFDENIELALYDCLLSSVIAPSDTQANVMPMALKVFQNGLNSRINQV